MRIKEEMPDRLFSWDPERRARQADLCRQQQPWRFSTGPKTQEGKAKVARNAWKGGKRQRARAFRRWYRALMEQGAGAAGECPVAIREMRGIMRNRSR